MSVNWEDVDEAKKQINALAAKMAVNMGIPELDYDNLHEELNKYYDISIEEDMDTNQINDMLTKMQNIRSRVAFITSQAMRTYKAKKTIVDMLMAILVKEADASKYKNKEAREGFATERLLDLNLDLRIAEFLKDNAEMCLNNLNNMISTVSRQISVLQIELQLGQLTRYNTNDDGDDSDWVFKSSDSLEDILNE